MQWLPPGPTGRRTRSALRRSGWLLLFLGVPLVAAGGLQVLHSYAVERQQVALQLEHLSADLNAIAADAGWAVALGVPSREAQADVSAGVAAVSRDMASLRRASVGDLALSHIEAATASFLDNLRPAASSVDGTLDTTSPAAVAGFHNADKLYDRASELIDVESVSLARTANFAETAAEIGIWTLSLISTLLLCL